MFAKLRSAAPWVLVIAFFLLPLYAITAAFTIRSGIFDLRDRTIGPDEYKALWAFIASGLGTAATIIGLLLARSHNLRTLALQADIENRKLAFQEEAEDRKSVLERETSARLALDTAVKGLELVADGEGGYAPKARVAGALAALVHLGHPVIAMRTLEAAWDDAAVDKATACWLISEVYQSGSESSQIEASALLRTKASTLPEEEGGGDLEWPSAFWSKWLTDLPLEARYNNLLALVEVLLSRRKDWWDGTHGWVLILIDEAYRHDPDQDIRNAAAVLLTPILASFGEDRGGWSFHGEQKSFEEIEADSADSNDVMYDLAQEWWESVERLGSWAMGKKVGRPQPGKQSESRGNAAPAEDGRRRRPPAGRP
jgi:hypothetical protein